MWVFVIADIMLLGKLDSSALIFPELCIAREGEWYTGTRTMLWIQIEILQLVDRADQEAELVADRAKHTSNLRTTSRLVEHAPNRTHLQTSLCIYGNSIAHELH